MHGTGGLVQNPEVDHSCLIHDLLSVYGLGPLMDELRFVILIGALKAVMMLLQMVKLGKCTKIGTRAQVLRKKASDAFSGTEDSGK